MRLREAVTRIGNAEVAVVRIGAQTVGFKVLVAVMADRDALLWARAFDGRRRATLAGEFFARRRFGGGLSRERFSGGRFLPCAAAACRSRGLFRGLLFGHRRAPYRDGRRDSTDCSR